MISTHPADTAYVLQDNFDNWIKPENMLDIAAELFGKGIFASNGSNWAVQRKGSKTHKTHKQHKLNKYKTRIVFVILIAFCFKQPLPTPFECGTFVTGDFAFVLFCVCMALFVCIVLNVLLCVVFVFMLNVLLSVYSSFVSPLQSGCVWPCQRGAGRLFVFRDRQRGRRHDAARLRHPHRLHRVRSNKKKKKQKFFHSFSHSLLFSLLLSLSLACSVASHFSSLQLSMKFSSVSFKESEFAFHFNRLMQLSQLRLFNPLFKYMSFLKSEKQIKESAAFIVKNKQITKLHFFVLRNIVFFFFSE
jgi:hypothetical protein